MALCIDFSKQGSKKHQPADDLPWTTYQPTNGSPTTD